MTDRKTMIKALRDARSKALFNVNYDRLTVAQKWRVDELMQSSSKYAKAEQKRA
jgi:hypothetical protein